MLVQHLVSSSRNLCTEQSPKDSDDTICCINTLVLLKMSTIVLETCRGIYNKCIKIKNLCIKLVKKTIISFILIQKFPNPHFQPKTASLNSGVRGFVHSFHLNAGLRVISR